MTRLMVPCFTMFEFDDRGCGPPTDVPVRRWLGHCDGLVGLPAEEVSLGWSAGAAVAVVCTSGHRYDDTEARRRAAHLALGGDALPMVHRPAGATETLREIERIGSAEDLWSRGRALVSGMSAPAAAVECDGFAAAYVPVGAGTVFVAAVGVAAPDLRVPEMQGWTGYDVDVPLASG